MKQEVNTQEERHGKGQSDFLLQGGILALASFVVRLIGMIYRIPMVNIIGSEGNGYYSNAFSVYNILLLLSSYSLPLAVSRMISVRVAHGKWKETKRITVVAIIFAAVVGTVFGLLTFFLSDFFCTTLLRSPLSSIALKMLAPTVAIVAFLGVFRGFFQGLQTMIPTAVSQIIEQIINAIFSVVMAAVLAAYGARIVAETGQIGWKGAWGAAGGTIGTGAGALAALIFLVVLFFSYRKTLEQRVRKDPSKKIASQWKLLSILSLTAVPIILSTATYNAIDIIDAALFNHASGMKGLTVDVYTATWGDYNSAYLLLVHLPVALASAIGSALVPALAAAYSRQDHEEVMKKIELAIRVTLLIAIPCAFGYMAIGGNLAKLLFPGISDEAQTYLAAGGLAVAFHSLATVTNAILQGLNRMRRPMIHSFISLAGHVLLLVLMLFVFKMGIFAVIICYMIFSLVIAVLNILAIKKLTGYRLNPKFSILMPVIVSAVVVVICLVVAFIFSRFLSGRILNLLIVLVSLILGIAVYLAGILLTGCLRKAQVLELPFGKKMVKLFTKLRLLHE